VAEYKLRVPQQVQSAINAATRLCAVFGSPIGHSASPAMQNAAFVALGLNWRYLAFEVDPKNLRAAIEGAKAMNFAGINLTVPHKTLALDFVDALDNSAKTFGAVNTIRFERRNADGAWLPLRKPAVAGEPLEIRAHGFNTDAVAIAQTLREDVGLELRGAKVVLLGAGGTGRTVALKFASENVAELFLVNRTQSKAVEIANEIKKRFPAVRASVGYPTNDVDLLMNATSLGLSADDPLPLDEKQFSLRRARAVYDVIYRPAETKLLAVAKKSGCKTANGVGMLLRQGATAFEIWTGKPAPVKVMRRAVEQSIYGH
jgi:shikimate dehydrogenase